MATFVVTMKDSLGDGHSPVIVVSGEDKTDALTKLARHFGALADGLEPDQGLPVTTIEEN